MKTLLQINTTSNAAATGRIAENIGLLAMSQGWNSYIAHGIRQSKPSKSKTIRINGIIDFYYHALQTRLFDKHGLASKRATKKLVKKINEIKPDIIHLHNLHGYYINIEILFQYLATKTIPVVWTLHDCWTFTGHCTYFDMVKCEKWKKECNNCPQKRAYPSSIFSDRSRANFSIKKNLFKGLNNLTLVPVSHWLGDLLDHSFLKKIPLKVIHNGLDLKVFYPKSTNQIKQKYKLDNSFLILGVANKWDKRKGFEDFIFLSKKLKKDEKIVLIGLNEKQLKVLPKNIIGIKKTENLEELCGFYSVADVFVNATYDDNFPTTNIESLACGTPIITYNTGGSVEAVTKETGFIVEQGSIEGLISCIREVKILTKQFYTNSCRKRAENFFDKKIKYQEYIDLYYKLITSRS